MEHDWAMDFIIDYAENGQRYRTIWSGLTREGAIEEFLRAYPERTVVTVEGEHEPQ